MRGAAFAAPIVVTVGILLGDALGPDPAAPMLAAAFVLGALVVVGRSPHTRAAGLLALLFVLAGALECRALNGSNTGSFVAAAATRADATVTGTVVEDPDGPRWSTRLLLRTDRAELRDRDRVRVVREKRTLLVVADGTAAGRLAVLAAGDRIRLRGWLRPLEAYDERLRWRHVVARLDALDLVDVEASASPLAAVANVARGIVLDGTDVVAPTERALVAGFLLGDTRDLPDPVLDDFRAAGLSHLLAVSGANVAFVLALIAPALRRSTRLLRLAATLAALCVFGAMTRWEPSVLRACAMAATAVLASHVGRPANGVRALALAIAALLLIDPFLLRSVGFLLSCGASLGITVLAAPISRRLRGPGWLRESIGTTAAAQLGVAPVLLPVFGSIPLVSIPANLLAVPLAGPLTTWGLTGGVAAGAVQARAPALADLLQTPTRVLAEAMLGLADLASASPASLDARDLAIVVAVVVFSTGIVIAARARRRMLRERALVVPPR